jgi:cadmium resistance protein CadD (predicted permease)
VSSLVATLITGVISFAATNIDDIFVVTFFFSQSQRHRWRIVLGQYLGFTALIVISLAGFFGGRVLPHGWIRFLGIVPIAIGIKRFLVKRDDELKRRGVGVFDVAFLTFANGGDNIGVYTPLFAVSDVRQLLELLVLFYLLIGVWCLVGYLIPRQQAIGNALKRGERWIVSLVLVGLGLYIILK